MASVNQELAARYASALFDLADEHKALDQVSNDLGTIKGLFNESPELGQLARSPLVKAEDRARAFGGFYEHVFAETFLRKYKGCIYLRCR